MKKIIAIILCLALALAVAAAQADVGLDVAKRSHQAILNFIYSHPTNEPENMYEVEPSTSAPFSPGKLNPQLVQHALNALNSLRFVAGISSNVEESQKYAEMAQAAALVNAVNGSMSHYPPQPAGMDDELYQLGYNGANHSNIALGYGSPIDALLRGWINDGDSRNIDRVGHRRWVLNPLMTHTGFGAVGRHTAMFASGGSWDKASAPARVAWPGQLMPFNWMSSGLPWSVSFRDGVSDGARVTITRRSDGKTWNLYEGCGDGYFHIDRGGYGTGECLIFRPDGISYTLGDHYDVTITGAEAQTVRYSVELYNFDKTESFVDRCYSVILGRAGESEGVAGWAAALRNKSRTAAEIINSFMGSDEFLLKNLDYAQTVDTLYQAMLGRAADPAGKSAWVEVLEAGNPAGVIINGFCGSAEFTNLCSNYGINPGSVPGIQPVAPANPAADMEKIRAFVVRCYEIILGRGVDAVGLRDWSNALASGQAQASQIIDGIVNSDEFKLRNLTNEQKVEVLYLAMLDRGPDPEGKAAWVQALADGHPYGVIINGFCGSIEFKGICDRFGITPGSVQVRSAMVKRVSIDPEGADPAAPVVRAGYNSEFINEEKVRAFVKHCYESVLEREGDAEGVEAYTGLILNGRKTPKQVAYEFVFSPEFQNRLPGNEAFIRILYRLYLNREPNAEELAGWVAMLEGGTSLEEIVKGFADGAEFRAIVREMKE